MVKAIEGVSGDEVALMSSLHSDDVFGVNTDSVKALSTDPERVRLRGSMVSGQADRERAADLMAGGGNAFEDYTIFTNEEDSSSFPPDDLAQAGVHPGRRLATMTRVPAGGARGVWGREPGSEWGCVGQGRGAPERAG